MNEQSEFCETCHTTENLLPRDEYDLILCKKCDENHNADYKKSVCDRCGKTGALWTVDHFLQYDCEDFTNYFFCGKCDQFNHLAVNNVKKDILLNKFCDALWENVKRISEPGEEIEFLEKITNYLTIRANNFKVGEKF